uniref:F-box domain-containing protein n=1 Tax=Rhizophora mucronata TaxID=61149 RepID=A0A2P2JLA4_RHIMU
MREIRKKKSKDMEMLDDLRLLPDDILAFEIFVRLSVMDVIRCMFVCKQWYSLIKTPQFISAHLSCSSFSSSTSQPSMFVYHFCFNKRRRLLSSHCDPQSFNDYHEIPYPFPLHSFFTILGPIHGLFCLFNDGDDVPTRDRLYCLWNPSVRRYTRLPLPTFSDKIKLIARGFGFDCKNKDYKAVVLVYFSMGKDGFCDTPDCQVVSLKQRSWRTLVAPQETKCHSVSGNGLFVNGALHWVAKKNRDEDPFFNFVLAFDIANETFKKMELPQELLRGSHRYSILEAKGSLACFDYHKDVDDLIPGPPGFNGYSIWVMKEYGMANSWIQMCTFAPMEKLLWVYGFWGNGDEILIKKEGYSGRNRLFLYDTKTQGSKDFGGGAEPDISRIYAYTESLVLLDEESGAVSYERPRIIYQSSLHVDEEKANKGDDD